MWNLLHGDWSTAVNLGSQVFYLNGFGQGIQISFWITQEKHMAFKKPCIRITFNIYYLSFSLSSSWLSSGSSRKCAEGRGCHPAACKLQTLASACSWEGHSPFLVRTGLLHGHPQIMDLWHISRKNDAGLRPALNNAGALLSTRPALQNLSQKKF